jgi:deoxyribodipyrimidine photolyase
MHDNVALSSACAAARAANAPLLHLYVIDDGRRCGGVLRHAFLLDSLRDVDLSLRKQGSRLYVVRGAAEKVLPDIVEKFGVKSLFYEQETAEWARKRDSDVCQRIVPRGVKVNSTPGHMMYDLQKILGAHNGTAPRTMAAMQKVMRDIGEPDEPTEPESEIPPPPSHLIKADESVPNLKSLGFSLDGFKQRYRGGEGEALTRLTEFLERNGGKDAAIFEKVSIFLYVFEWSCISQIFTVI